MVGAGRRKPSRGQGLSRRELEIISLLAYGYTAQEVAGKLFLTESTVKNHTQFAYRKLGVNCLVQALLELGWLTPPEITDGQT